MFSAMIASIQFRNFKALRSTSVRLEPFNLVIGPNGSGKTSLIQALLRLRTLAALPAADMPSGEPAQPDGPCIEFTFQPPAADVAVRLGCVSETMCDLLTVRHPPGPEGLAIWEKVRADLRSVRAFLFDHYAMAEPAPRSEAPELSSNAGNLAAVLADRQQRTPPAFAALTAEFCRLLPEFTGIELRATDDGRVGLWFPLADGSATIPAGSLSQGTLYQLAILSLAFAPRPPAIVCIEEVDRGVHPRRLREVRDTLYRLSHPGDAGLDRAPVQVVATTHSPYMLDLFKDHPEEIVLANKTGNQATFERLADRTDLADLLREANLGDLWFSGIFGGVPGDE